MTDKSKILVVISLVLSFVLLLIYQERFNFSLKFIPADWSSKFSQHYRNNIAPFEKYLLKNFPGSQDCEPPVNDSDLPRHKVDHAIFNCDKPPPKTSASKSRTFRSQLNIQCADVTHVTANQKRVKFYDKLQKFRSAVEKHCLREYIRQNCQDHLPVPNVVHLLWYGKGKQTLEIRSAIGFYSILTVLKPCLVVLHGNVEYTGHLWDAILPLATNVVYVHKEPQTEISGRKIRHVQNQADIGRIQILLEYGGIYLDSDMVITKNLDIFRHVQFAANREGGGSALANGVMLAVPGQELLKTWLDNWDTYNGVSWTSHSTQGITNLAKRYPHLISHLGPIFIKFGFGDTIKFYRQTCSLGESYGAHLYRQHFPRGTDINTIKRNKSTFGRLARFVLFGDSKLCS